MMAQWNEGAVTDIPAGWRFCREATPIWLVTVCTLLGCRAPSLTRPFRYADLGCGAGCTALVVAAANPHAEVWGFDFNPANIENARELAEQSGLTNVHFREVSFETLAATSAELPEFDFMIAEAVLSDVSQENQRHIHTLIGRHLRPGGLAYLGYNVETGWAEFEPLQTFLRMEYELGPDTSEFAISQGFDALDRLKLGGALYFTRNPDLPRRLSEMRRQSDSDLAREFLSRDWNPLMFSDVAEAMAEVKCDFVGRATPRENIAPASVSPGMVALLDKALSIRIRETMQDIAAATVYRRDIYRRGLAFMRDSEHLARLEALTVAGLIHGTVEPPNWPPGTQADPAPYERLMAALREAPLTLAEARELRSPADRTIEDEANAIALLIGAGHAHPVMPPAIAHKAAPGVAALNEAIVDAIIQGDQIGFLASPVLGTAIEVSPLEALTIHAIRRGASADDVDGIAEIVAREMVRGGRSVMRDGVAVEDGAEAKSILHDPVAEILRSRIPLFRGLGVLVG